MIGGAARSGTRTLVPSRSGIHLDDFGVLRSPRGWVSLSRTQEVIMRVLIDHIGEAVGRDQLAALTWPGGGPDAHGIDVHIHKLRPRLKEIGLVIHTLRGRGFMLETSGGESTRRRR